MLVASRLRILSSITRQMWLVSIRSSLFVSLHQPQHNIFSSHLFTYTGFHPPIPYRYTYPLFSLPISDILQSNACVPATNLFDSFRRPGICPTSTDRFEIRTGALGCGCSATTLLGILITIPATIVAIGVLYLSFLFVRALWRMVVVGRWSGWQIEIGEDGQRREKGWSRVGLKSWVSSILGMSGLRGSKSEQEEITERSRLLGHG